MDTEVNLHVSQGAALLDFIESPEFTAEAMLGEEELDGVDEGELRSLVENLKVHAPSWRAFVNTESGYLTINLDR